MKFGKLADISQVDFSLPETDPRTMEVLGGAPSSSPVKVFTGCPKWASKEWVGVLFPPKTKQADYLQWYSQSFNTIELNTTHYRIPKIETVKKWKESAHHDFIFCPKLPQTISHYAKLLNQGQTTAFCEAIRHFEEKLGPTFVQMHPSFGPEQIGNLEIFLSAWPSDLPILFEFRHEGWFQDQLLIGSVYELLTQYGSGALITDVSGRRDVLHMSLTNRILMLRFVGNALHPTDFQRVDDWMKRIKAWVKEGLEEVYFFAHEPADLLASDLGKYAIQQFNATLGLSLSIPGVPDTNSQMSLF
ncbi:MAG: DUF72 domain-containing protein [Bacteroidota bacterium]